MDPGGLSRPRCLSDPLATGQRRHDAPPTDSDGGSHRCGSPGIRLRGCGAEAFVGYLFGILRRANATPDPSLVAPLVDQGSCSDCKHWVDSLASMRTAGEHFVGDFVVPQNVITRQITGSTAVVVATVVTPAGQRVDSHGTVVHTRTSTGPFRYDLRLEFRKHWVVVYAESVL